MEGSGRRTSDGSLLLVVGKAFSSEVRRSSLGDLDDNRRLDVPIGVQYGVIVVIGANAYLAASRTALAVDEDVTFCAEV